MLASAYTQPQLQPLQPIQPMHALAIDQPAFSSQHHVDALKAESRSHLCDLADAHPQRPLILGHAYPVKSGV